MQSLMECRQMLQPSRIVAQFCQFIIKNVLLFMAQSKNKVLHLTMKKNWIFHLRLIIHGLIYFPKKLHLFKIYFSKRLHVNFWKNNIFVVQSLPTCRKTFESCKWFPKIKIQEKVTQRALIKTECKWAWA